MTTPAPRLYAVPLAAPLTGHTGTVLWGVWGSVDGLPVLATGDRNGAVRLWDPAAGLLLRQMSGPSGSEGWGAWGIVDGQPVLATGGFDEDPSVRLWDPATGQPLGEPLTGHHSRWGSWGIVDGRSMLATGGRDGKVRLWDPATGLSLHRLGGRYSETGWGAWSSVDGRPVLSTDGEERFRSVWHWDPVNGWPLGESDTGHRDTVLWGAWGHADGRPVLATGSRDHEVRLLKAVEGRTLYQLELGSLTGHTGPVLWGAWGNVDGRPVLATGSHDLTVRLWDPVTGQPLGEPLTGHTDPVLWGAWGSAGGRPVLATGSHDLTVRLWEVVEDLPVERLPSYRSDVAAVVDALDRAGDAQAVAELITARTAKPPLAVGLFGDWGEGKSHFLGLLQQQVETTARPGNVLAHDAVRQVRFNAWHYAETDLWASLVTELFTQLSAPVDGDQGAEQRRHSRLTAELIAHRGLRERLRAARDRHQKLQHILREPAGLWERLPEHQQQELRLLVGDRPEELYQQATRHVAALRETGQASWRLIRGVPLGTVARFLALTGGLGAVAVGVAWGLPSLWRLIAAVPGIAGVWAAVQLADRFTEATRSRLSDAWKMAQQFAERQRQRLETAAEVAAAEVTALETQLRDLTAAGQLAGLVAERAAGADYRSRLGVMTQIRQDFQRMAALLAAAAHEREPGGPPPGDPAAIAGPGRARVSGAATPPRVDEADDELPRIDRIILYIDDLDRCPPRRVVEMLEAIHLLLAVELFVVVVAVDPRWLLRAIETHYRDLLRHPAAAAAGEQAGAVDPDDEELWQSTPAQYLEKIFQVVLTLPPLDTGGYRQLLRTLVGTRADRPGAAAAASPSTGTVAAGSTPGAPPPSPSEGVPGPAGGRQETQGAGGPGQQGLFGVELPSARVVERVDPLTLEPDEVALLDLLGPPLLVTTPRGAKRLANSYGLLTALRRGHRQADLAEQHATIADRATGQPTDVTYVPYRAGMVLLATLIAYPDLGPALFLHLHHTAATHPDQTWQHYRTSLTPRQDQGRWHNAAHPRMTPVQAQQWQALLRGLDHVTREAHQLHLDLPEPLTAWAQWIVPVGRLSFPTGRTVSALERQRPLDF